MPSTAAGSRSSRARSARWRQARRARRTPAERRAIAVDLLRDPAFDALLSGRSAFADLPAVMAKLADGSLPALCHTIRYAAEPEGAPCSA